MQIEQGWRRGRVGWGILEESVMGFILALDLLPLGDFSVLNNTIDGVS